MKKVEVKTPLGLETFLFLDGALVRPEDVDEWLLEAQKRTDLLDLNLWGKQPMDSSQN